MTEPSGIAAPLAAALAKRGYETLTPVQLAVLAEGVEGHDLLVSAQTGSGKTVAFGIAIAPDLLAGEDRFLFAGTPMALVIAPTRELALQVKRELDWLYEDTGAQVASCVGGMDYRTERRALDKGAHIVVGTPGRLKDHIERGSLDLSAIRAVVLDEADEMLDLGFAEDLEFILGSAPESRRTLMFSATVPPAIAQLAKQYQRDAVRLKTAAEQKQHVDIEYRALTVAPHDREHAIINLLRFYEAKTALVFCKTRAEVTHLMGRFHNRGFSVVALSGELSQQERTHALQSMRDGRARVCIATDVAARGIDLPGLELVIHADLPSNPETLLHRSGRTGRAGQKGVSALIVMPKDYKKAQRILQGARITATWATAPSAEEVQARDDVRLIEAPELGAPIAEDEAAAVAALTSLHSADALAAAFLRMWRAGRSAPEELHSAGTPTEEVRRPREEFGDSAWYRLSVGREGRAEARWLLPKLCDQGGITKTEIGAIRVQQDVTFVQIAAGAAAGFEASLGSAMELEAGLTLTRLAAEPVLERPERPERPERFERPERPERFERSERSERPTRAPRPEVVEERPAPSRAPVEDRPAPAPRAYAAAADDHAPATVQGKKSFRAAKYETGEPVKAPRRIGVKPARRDDAPRPAYEPRGKAPFGGAKKPYQPRGDAAEGPRKPWQPRGDAADGPKKPYQPRSDAAEGPRKPWQPRGDAPADAGKKPRWVGAEKAARPGKPFGAGKPATGGSRRPPVNPADTSQRMKPRPKPQGK
jgi:ATP-dependent RNA helicase DeaD